MSEVTAGVIDLLPAIRRRANRDCQHRNVEVGHRENELVCTDCGAALDPWQLIRAFADDDARWREYHEELRSTAAKQVAEHDEWLARINERRKQLTADIQHLQDTKIRLQQETINGVRVGIAARRRRPRK